MAATRGGGELELWNPFGKNLDLGVHTPQWLDRGLAGTGQGMTNVVRHVGNLVGLESNKDLANAAQLDAPLLKTTAGKVGNFLGTTAITAPLMGGVSAGALRAGGLLGDVAANAVGRGALEGATQGFLTADPGNRLSGTLSGGVLGAALPGAGKFGGKLLRGAARSPEAQALLDRGIDLTPGLLNPRGQRNLSEEALQSAPFVGAMIRRARERPMTQWAQAAMREGSAPGASIPAADTSEMLTHAYQSFDPLYEQAKGFPVRPAIMREGADSDLNDVFRNAVGDKSSLASESERGGIRDFLDNEATRFNGSSDSLLEMRSNIRAKIRELQPGDQRIKLLKNAEHGLTQALDSQLPKDAQTALRTADSRYGQYKTLESAVAKAKDQSTGMTPTHLSNAVEQNTPKGVYARGGGGPLRDLAREGKEVFDVRARPTGERLGVLGAGMEGLRHPYLAVPLALARLGTIATRPGRALMAGNLGAQKAATAALQSLQTGLPSWALPVAGRYARAALGARYLPQFPQAAATGAGLLGDAESLVP